MKTQLFGAAFVKAGTIFFSYLVNYALVLAMARDEFGRFSLMMSVATILSLAVTLGHPQLIVRAVAGQFGDQDEENPAQGWKLSLAWIFGIGITGISLVASWGFFRGFSEYVIEGLVVAMILPVWAMLRMQSALLHGMHFTTLAQATETLFRPAIFSASILLVIFAGTQTLITIDVLTLNLFAFGIAAALTYLLCAQKGVFSALKDSRPIAQNSFAWFLSSARLAMISAAQVLILNFDILMIGLLKTDEDVAVYRVAILAAMLVGALAEVINVVVRPRIAESHANKNLHVLLPRIRKLQHAASVGGAIALLGFGIFGKSFLGTVVGAEYLSAYVPILVLVASQVVILWFGPVGLILNMTRNETAHSKIIFAALLVNIVMNAILIPTFGIIGASIASLIAIVYSRIASVKQIESSLKIRYMYFVPKTREIP